MVSVDALLDAHEVVVRARVDSLREQAARVAVELGEAQVALDHVEITRATIAVVTGQDSVGSAIQSIDVEKQGTVVPPWREDLSGAHLPVEYRRVWHQVAEAGGPVRSRQLTVALGLEPSPARVEAVRYKLKRLVTRGWLTEPSPGMFAPCSTGPVS